MSTTNIVRQLQPYEHMNNRNVDEARLSSHYTQDTNLVPTFVACSRFLAYQICASESRSRMSTRHIS